jgi:hypothetical protein
MTVEEFAKNLTTAAGQGYALTEFQRLLLTAPERVKFAISGGARSASRSS